LITRFDRPDTPYEAKRRSASAFKRAYNFDDYAQLARVQEWSDSGGEGEG
jgi:ATP-dependent helicase/nuclease subunit B